MLEDQRLRKKLTNKSKLLSDELQKPFQSDQTSRIESELTADIEGRQIEERTTQWWAKKSGLEDFYNTAYAVFSIAVHASSRDLESHLRLDSNRRIVAIQTGPNSAELDILIVSVCESLIMIGESAQSIFNKSEYEEFVGYRKDLFELNQSIGQAQ